MSAAKIIGIAVKTATIRELAHERLEFDRDIKPTAHLVSWFGIHILLCLRTRLCLRPPTTAAAATTPTGVKPRSMPLSPYGQIKPIAL